jgi:hypothetical protein
VLACYSHSMTTGLYIFLISHSVATLIFVLLAGCAGGSTATTVQSLGSRLYEALTGSCTIAETF